MDLKSLPYAIKSEQEILGAILKDNNKIIDIDGLSEEDFYKESHKLIYRAMHKLYSNNSGIDIYTLANILKNRLEDIGGITYLSELYSASLTVNYKDHVNIVKDKSNRRAIIKHCQNTIASAYEEGNDISHVIDSFQNSVLDVGCSKDDILTAQEMMYRTIKNIEFNFSNGGNIIGMPTGLNSLDNATDGIIKRDLIVVAARPSMGKTLLALNITDNLSVKNKVLLFELEMNEEALGHRMLANKTKINSTRIRRGNLSDTQWATISKHSNNISSRNLFVDTNMNSTVFDIKRKAKRVKMQHGLDCIIIDHIGLIKPSNPKLNRQQQVAEISRELKQIAKELDIAVIILSQLNRGPEQRADHRPMLSDLREAGDIEQDADIVIFLYRDEYYNQETSDKNIMEAIIAKQRNGRVGTVKLFCNLETQTIGDLFN